MAPDSEAPLIACFLATSGHSGVDRAAVHLLPALARRGYRVDLLKVLGHGPHLTEHPMGLQVIELGTRHANTSLLRVARYLRRARPAAMLTDKDRVNRTAIIARLLARAPTRLLVSSGTTISIDLQHRGRFERWVQRNSMKWLYPRADLTIVSSEGVADDMAAYTGLARERIRAVPNPVVPPELFEHAPPPPEHPWFDDDTPPVILGVGELSFRKDFATLVRAFARLRARRECRLVILGEGRQRDALLALARGLGVADDVDLPGFVSSPYAYMAHANVFALTSRWEGLGFVLIEALALGIPSVTTDCPSGPREVLQDGRCGPLVPIGDDEALAGAIESLLDHPPPRERLREAARPYEIESATTAYLAAFGLPPYAPCSGEVAA